MEDTILIRVRVNGRRAVNTTPEITLVGWNEGDKVLFEFDEEWEVDSLKTAVFTFNGDTVRTPFRGNECEIPILRRAEILWIGVESDNPKLRTSTSAKVKCEFSTEDLAGREIPPPTPNEYDTLIGMINAGMVKGDKGEPFEYEDFTPEQLEDLRSELAVDYREEDESLYISGYDPNIDLNDYPTKVEVKDELAKKQDTVAFDGVYNAETNKAATVETVIRKVAEIVAGAPEDFDTLKELSEWLISHEGSAAAMNSAIAKNAENIEKTKTETDEKLSKKVDKIAFSKDTTVHGSDAGYVGRAYIVDHDGNQNSMALNAQAFNYTVPYRNHNANFCVGDPALPYECANRGYVDKLPDKLKLTDDSTAEDGTVTKGTRTKWLEWLGAVKKLEADGTGQDYYGYVYAINNVTGEVEAIPCGHQPYGPAWHGGLVRRHGNQIKVPDEPLALRDATSKKYVDGNLAKKQDVLAFDGEYNAETNKAATVETVVQKIAEIVANAPEDFNTLKELSDWLTEHSGTAAEMNSAILKNTEEIEKVRTETAESIEEKTKITYDEATESLTIGGNE